MHFIFFDFLSKNLLKRMQAKKMEQKQIFAPYLLIFLHKFLNDYKNTTILGGLLNPPFMWSLYSWPLTEGSAPRFRFEKTHYENFVKPKNRKSIG